MKMTTCLVCKYEFFGRNNQIFCSTACKNQHYNQKTRLIYSAGKFGSQEISNLQEQSYSNKAKIIEIKDNFDNETAQGKAVLGILKTDYMDLMKKYEKIKIDLEKIRGKYIESLRSAKKLEEQLMMIKVIGELIGPSAKKIIENLVKIEKEKDI